MLDPNFGRNLKAFPHEDNRDIYGSYTGSITIGNTKKKYTIKLLNSKTGYYELNMLLLWSKKFYNLDLFLLIEDCIKVGIDNFNSEDVVKHLDRNGFLSDKKFRNGLGVHKWNGVYEKLFWYAMDNRLCINYWNFGKYEYEKYSSITGRLYNNKHAYLNSKREYLKEMIIDFITAVVKEIVTTCNIVVAEYYLDFVTRLYSRKRTLVNVLLGRRYYKQNTVSKKLIKSYEYECLDPKCRYSYLDIDGSIVV